MRLKVAFAGLVGRTPRSAADALVGFFGVSMCGGTAPGSGADQGIRPTVETGIPGLKVKPAKADRLKRRWDSSRIKPGGGS